MSTSTDRLNSRNIQALNENDKTMNGKLSEIEMKVRTLEATVAYLKADLANTKQLVGHSLGRGMGSTVQQD